MPMLSLGCGKDQRPGWVRLDANRECNPDIWAVVPPLPPAVTERQWDVIELNHVLASLYRWDAKKLLCQIWQVLAPGGMLIIETPDIAFCMEHFLGRIESPPGDWQPGQLDLWGFWGNPTDHNPSIANRWGYTPGSLRELLVECGFNEARIQERPAAYHVPARDFRMEATK